MPPDYPPGPRAFGARFPYASCAYLNGKNHATPLDFKEGIKERKLVFQVGRGLSGCSPTYFHFKY